MENKEIEKKFKEIDKILEKIREEIKALEKIVADNPYKNGRRVICNKCNYSWNTKTQRSRVTCPDCGNTIKI